MSDITYVFVILGRVDVMIVNVICYMNACSKVRPVNCFN